MATATMALYSSSPPAVMQSQSSMNCRTNLPGSDLDWSMRKPATNHTPPCSKPATSAISGGLSHMFSLPSSTSKHQQYLSSQSTMVSGVCAASSDYQACDLASSTSEVLCHGYGGVGILCGGNMSGSGCVVRDFATDACRASSSSSSSPFCAPLGLTTREQRSPVSVLLGVGGSYTPTGSGSRVGSYTSSTPFGSPSSLTSLHSTSINVGGGRGSLPSSFENSDRSGDRISSSSSWNSRRSHSHSVPERRSLLPSRATTFGFPCHGGTDREGVREREHLLSPVASLGGGGGIDMVDIVHSHSLRLSARSASSFGSEGGMAAFATATPPPPPPPLFSSSSYGDCPPSLTPARSVTTSAVTTWSGGSTAAAVTLPPLIGRDDPSDVTLAFVETSEGGVCGGGCSSGRSGVCLDDVLGWGGGRVTATRAGATSTTTLVERCGGHLRDASIIEHGTGRSRRRGGGQGVGSDEDDDLPPPSQPPSPSLSSSPSPSHSRADNCAAIDVPPAPPAPGPGMRIVKEEDDTSSQLNRVVVRRLLLRAQSRHKLFYDPLVKRAFSVAATAHEGQMRLNGDPYLCHCVETAIVLAETCNDKVLVAAGLLHDTLDDSMMNERQLQEMFGSDITNLITGVSKMSHISQLARERQAPLSALEAERLRNMFLAMADYRVVLIKLADRLHNMRTLEVLSPVKQKRLAEETLEIFAPLANRLGIWSWKAELEDLCFMYLQPESYRELAAMLRDSQRGDSLMTAMRRMDEGLRESGVAYEDLCGRPKNLFSVWTKMKNKGRRIDEIFDVRGLRLIVHSEADCYAAMEMVRSLWIEVPGKSKDYIKNPKGNGYQSLHTIILIEDGRPLELQIRTVDMHQRAEFGMAAHWRYKEQVGDNYPLHVAQKVEWARCLLTWKNEMDKKLRLAPHEGGSVRKPCPFPEHLSECPYGTLGSADAGGENDEDPLFIIMLEGDLMQVQELPGGSTASDLVSERVLGMTTVMDTPPGVIRPLVNHYLVEDLSQKLRTGDLVEFVVEPELEPTLSPILPLHGIAQRGKESARAVELAVEFERQRLSRWFQGENVPQQLDSRRKGCT